MLDSRSESKFVAFRTGSGVDTNDRHFVGFQLAMLIQVLIGTSTYQHNYSFCGLLEPRGDEVWGLRGQID